MSEIYDILILVWLALSMLIVIVIFYQWKVYGLLFFSEYVKEHMADVMVRVWSAPGF